MAKDKESKPAKSIEELQKRFGESLLIAGNWVDTQVERLPSGSLALDWLIGWPAGQQHGGWPMGTIVEIFGGEASGKTSLVSHAFRSAHAHYEDKKTLILDMEHTYNMAYAEKLGVDKEKILVSQPDTAEEALELCEACCESGLFSVVAIDSIAALIPKDEWDGAIGDKQVGARARVLSQAAPKISKAAMNSKTLVLCTNQERAKIGGFSPFGPQTTTTGGKSLPYYASVRIDLAYLGKIVNANKDPIGIKIKATGKKNKTSTPFRDVQFNLLFDRGIDWLEELLSVGVNAGMIKKKNAGYYQYGDASMRKDEIKDLIAKNDELNGKITEYIVDGISKGSLVFGEGEGSDE